jgi:hypothetical protein
MAGTLSGSDDFQLTVTDAYFAEVDFGDNSRLMLHLCGETDLEAQPIFDRDGYHPSWGVGGGWTSPDGKQAMHPEGKDGFHKRSAVQEALIDPALKLTEGLPADQDPFATPEASSLNAETWIGTSWRFHKVEFKFTINNEEVTSERDVPYQFLGKAGAPAPAATAPAAAASNGGGNKVLRAKVVALAKKADDYESFQAEALALDGVTDDDALLGEIVDETSGIWVEARA